MIDGRHLDDGDLHPAFLVHQLATQGRGEAVDGVLGSAVSGLKGDASLAEGGPHLDDGPMVAGPHPLEGNPGAVHVPEVAHLGDPGELLRLDVPEGREAPS